MPEHDHLLAIRAIGITVTPQSPNTTTPPDLYAYHSED